MSFSISLLLFTSHSVEGKAEPEAQFGGGLGFPSIGGPLKLRYLEVLKLRILSHFKLGSGRQWQSVVM